MKYTKKEKINHKHFIVSYMLQIMLLAMFGYSVKNQIIILGSMTVSAIILNSIWIFYIGYSHGWELKRISSN